MSLTAVGLAFMEGIPFKTAAPTFIVSHFTMDTIADIQGFLGANNEFVIKELAFAPFNESGTHPVSWIIGSPYDFNTLPVQKQSWNNIYENESLGIPWDMVGLPFCELQSKIVEFFSSARLIYVSGYRKKMWFKQFLKDTPGPVVVDVLDHYPNIQKMKYSREWNVLCSFHKTRPTMKCTVNNVMEILQFLKPHFNNSFAKSVQLYSDLKNLSLLDCKEIKHLPHIFISSIAQLDVHDAWEKLTDDMRADRKIARCRRCVKHPKTCDGPPPMMKDCGYCNAGAWVIGEARKDYRCK